MVLGISSQFCVHYLKLTMVRLMTPWNTTNTSNKCTAPPYSPGDLIFKYFTIMPLHKVHFLKKIWFFFLSSFDHRISTIVASNFYFDKVYTYNRENDRINKPYILFISSPTINILSQLLYFALSACACHKHSPSPMLNLMKLCCLCILEILLHNCKNQEI